MGSTLRPQMLHQLADVIMSVATPHPARVAVDGRPASGKTVLANELGELLRARGRYVIRATIDEFMYPKELRYRQGIDSPEGCYHDSIDFDALRRALLEPLGPGGARQFQEATYDRETDCVVSLPMKAAPVDAVLLFDGVFLMRPELNDCWELRLLVSTSFEESLRRARRRDAVALGTVTRIEERFRRRYLPSQTHYFNTVKPHDIADIIVENENPGEPTWLVRTGSYEARDGTLQTDAEVDSL